jgi:predicted Fe-S protein YdhL (DUF1289 family)
MPPSATNTDILTPCVGICTLTDAGYCEGCFRTASEIGSWLDYTQQEREHLMNTVLPNRATQLT